MKISIVVLLIFIARHCDCAQRAYKAFIPSESVAWFNKFLGQHHEIDVWLSTRPLTNQKLAKSGEKFYTNQTLSNSFLEKYKYYCEFRVGDHVDFEKNAVKFEKRGVKLELWIADLESHLERKFARERRQVSTIHHSSGSSLSQLTAKVIGRYATHLEIVKWMSHLAKKYPDLVQVSKIGTTFDKRPIMVLRLTVSNPRIRTTKPLFLFESGIHAREWVSIATNTYLIDRLINEYMNDDETVRRILQNFELHFIPVANPDGYEFSRASKFNRYWRKNMRFVRSQSSKHSCFGVDLNRNFDHKWMVAGASANPCAEIYAGLHPGSEPEVKAISSYIMSKSPRWVSYISLHSYGAMWIAPYSYSRTHILDNFEETCQKAMSAINKIKRTYDFDFKFGSASHLLYEASGCGEDWAKAIAHINHTYVIELKPENSDNPESGFEYPESELKTVAKEMYDGFIEYIKTFMTKRVDDTVVKQCKKQLNQMIKDIENFSFQDDLDEDEEDFEYGSHQ